MPRKLIEDTDRTPSEDLELGRSDEFVNPVADQSEASTTVAAVSDTFENEVDGGATKSFERELGSADVLANATSLEEPLRVPKSSSQVSIGSTVRACSDSRPLLRSTRPVVTTTSPSAIVSPTFEWALVVTPRRKAEEVIHRIEREAIRARRSH